MDPILREKIINKLRNYLNREPNEREIVNGETDVNLIRWIDKDDIELLKTEVDNQKKINLLNSLKEVK